MLGLPVLGRARLVREVRRQRHKVDGANVGGVVEDGASCGCSWQTVTVSVNPGLEVVGIPLSALLDREGWGWEACLLLPLVVALATQHGRLGEQRLDEAPQVVPPISIAVLGTVHDEVAEIVGVVKNVCISKVTNDGNGRVSSGGEGGDGI